MDLLNQPRRTTSQRSSHPTSRILFERLEQRLLLSNAFTAIDLGLLPGTTGESDATGINSLGDVVGTSDNGSNHNLHWFLWKSGGFSASGRNLLPVAVNDSDMIAGNSAQLTNHALSWTPASYLGYPQWVALDAVATGLSNSGTIVGWNILGGGFVWRPNTGLTTTPDYRWAINNNEQILATTMIVNPDGSTQQLPKLNDWPTGISSSGHVIGSSEVIPGRHAYLWESGSSVIDLGTLSGTTSSNAYSINGSDQIVGASGSKAFLWLGMTDLNSLLASSGQGWMLQVARCINDAGEIVGQGLHNGVERAFLLVPSSLSSILPPQNVQATQGNFPDHVGITWTAVDKATSYQIWRSTTNDTSTATELVTSTSTTSFNDMSAQPGVTYYYWLQATNTFTTSSFSAAAHGYALVSTEVLSNVVDEA